MKTKFLLFASVVFVGGKVCGQTPNWVWAKGGAFGQGSQVTTDLYGNVYVAGGYIMGGTHTVYLLKYDAGGNLIWADSTSGNGELLPSDVSTDAAGNIYTIGNVYSPPAYFDSIIVPTACMAVVKCDSIGKVLWVRSIIDTTTNNVNDEVSIATDANANVFVTGWFSSPTINFNGTSLTNYNSGSPDIFIAKYDSSGNVLWAKRAGSTNWEYSKGIATDAAGNAYITGYASGNYLTFDSITLSNLSGEALFLAKYNPNGNIVWAKAPIGGTSDGYAVTTDKSGNIYITGYLFGPSLTLDTVTINSNGRILIVKYDSTGNILWARSTGGVNCDPYSEDIATDSTGNVYATGYFYGDTISFGSTIFVNDTTNGGSSDLFVCSFDKNGNFRWAKNGTGDDTDFGYGIAATVSGDVYVTGYFEGSQIRFDSLILPGISSTAYFLAKLSVNIPLGSNELSTNNNTLQIYPNPAHNKLTVVFYSSVSAQNIVSLYDVMGRVVLEKSFKPSGGENKMEVDVAGVAQGVYVLRVGGERVKVVVE